jgi:hypothetical protein
MTVTRRNWLKLGLAGAAAASIHPLLGPSRTRAMLGPGPKKLLTIYVPGGWMPMYFFCPLTGQQVVDFFPGPGETSREPVFFDPSDLRNLDGTGDDPHPEDATVPRLRVPHLWDEAALSSGSGSGEGSSFGYAWRHYRLWEDATVIHGVDQGTASHASGRISAMSGIAGSNYRSPAIHSVVAHRLHEAFGDERPLGAVALGSAPIPNSLSLPSHAVATVMRDSASLASTLSDRQDVVWAGLRERPLIDRLGYDGGALGERIPLTAMDRFARRRARSLRGTTNAATDALYERIHETYGTVSTQLAVDIVSLLESTDGWDPSHPYPHWAFGDSTPYGVTIGRGNTSDSGSTWVSQFELALKLLKSDLASAISVEAPGVGNFYFDTHSNTGHNSQFIQVRATLDVIGRLLGEMKETPSQGGASTLLDDTLVVVMSEFARTWPGSGLCDHWPTTSVVMAGGGIRGNQMLGNYDLERSHPGASGPVGKPVSLIDEGGEQVEAPPESRDIVYTALQVMGISDVFLPGGPGEIVGVRS